MKIRIAKSGRDYQVIEYGSWFVTDINMSNVTVQHYC